MAKREIRIQLRTGRELDGLREAGLIAAEVLGRTCALVKAGITTGELDRAAAQFMADRSRSVKSAFLVQGIPWTNVHLNQ